MRNLARSIAIFHKIACSTSLEATTAIITITARSTVMFTVVCIFRGDDAHDLLLLVVGNSGGSKIFFYMILIVVCWIMDKVLDVWTGLDDNDG
jgi:hypothetical protein